MDNAFVSELTGEGLTRNSFVEPAEIIGDEMDAALAQFAERSAALVKAATDRVVTDNDSIGRAADTQSMIRALDEAVWARAKEIAAPHNRAVNVAKGKAERFLAELAAADQLLTDKIRDCRTAQRDRAAAQKREQAEREAALRGATEEAVNPQIDSGPIALPKVRGDYGSTVSDRALTTYSYADARKLPKAVLDMPAVEKAIQAALRAYVKVHKLPKGVTANADMTTTHRRPI